MNKQKNQLFNSNILNVPYVQNWIINSGQNYRIVNKDIH